ERPGLGRAEERRRGRARRGVPRVRGAGGGGGFGAAVYGVAVVRELLPAVIQVGREGPRWCESQEKIPSAGHALSAADGGYADQRGGAMSGDGDTRHLDPVQLSQTIRAGQQELVEIADRPTAGEAVPPTAPTMEQFLSGLRTAWREGEVRPTSKPKEKARRGRRRPDPFVTVTALMREWFEAEPWRTSRELFERLQKEQPGVY